jgi:hypothetical protein
MCRPLRFDAEHLDGHVVLVLCGELDLATAPSLRSVMLGLIESSGMQIIGLDDVLDVRAAIDPSVPQA